MERVMAMETVVTLVMAMGPFFFLLLLSVMLMMRILGLVLGHDGPIQW